MLAFFARRTDLARTPVGQRAVLMAQWRTLRRQAALIARLSRDVRSLQAARRIENHPLYDAFMCIHGHENGGHGWTANTGNGYYGGLQMDWDFMETYGGEYLRTLGTADKWPPEVQLRVAIRAHDSGRGFYPWPNTARYCGLI